MFDYDFSRHGFPDIITLLTDHAQSFRSELLKSFTKTFGIRHIYASPHHPRTNVRAENVAVSTNSALRTLCSTNQDTWPDHVQSIAMALRMTPSTSIGVSLFVVLYAESPQLGINSVLLPDDEVLPSAEAYVKTMKPKLTGYAELPGNRCEATRDSRSHG